MDNRNKAEKFWDRTAKTYDKEEQKDIQTYQRIIEKTRRYLKASDVVLDFGCGTGLVSNEIACNVGMVHAIDTSSKMIEIAKDKTTELKIQNIDYTCSTIFDDRQVSRSYDVILAFNILHLVDDSQKVIQRMNNLLKPGGIIVSATPCMGETPLLSNLFSLGSRIGIIPEIRALKISELESFFKKENFEIIESHHLRKNAPQYFLIARKLQGV